MERIDPKLLREVPYSEIYESYGFEDLEKIDAFQTDPIDLQGANPIQRILDQRFFPPSIKKKYGEEKLLGSLACNISFYNDEIESRLEADPLINSINYNRLKDLNHLDSYVIALRIRRSVLSTLIEDPAVLDPKYFEPHNHLNQQAN